MTCLNRVNFCLLTVARYGSCRPTTKLILLQTGVTGLVLYVEHMDTFPQALSHERLDLFLEVSKQGQRLTAIEEDGGNKRLVQLELPFELLRQTLFHLAIAAVAEAIFVWISVERVPPLHKVTVGYLKTGHLF